MDMVKDPYSFGKTQFARPLPSNTVSLCQSAVRFIEHLNKNRG